MELVCRRATALDIKMHIEMLKEKNKRHGMLLDAYCKRLIENNETDDTLVYFGFVDEKIACTMIIYRNAELVDDVLDFIDEDTVYLNTHSVEKGFEDQGYLHELFEYVVDDLKKYHVRRIVVGVTSNELAIFYNYGFTEYVKTYERFIKGINMKITYYAKTI